MASDFKVSALFEVVGTQEFRNAIDKVEGGLDGLARDGKKSLGDVKKSFDKAGKGAKKLADDTKKSADKIGSALKGMAGLVASAFAVQKIVAFGKGAVEAAADIEALGAQFEATFKDQVAGAYDLLDEADEMFKRVSDSAGIFEGRLKGIGTKVFSQFKGAGADVNTALENTETFLNLASDAAAYYDISLEDAEVRMRSFIRGNTEAGDMIGLFTSETQRNNKALEIHGKKYLELTEAQKQLLMLDVVNETYKNSGAIGQASREADGYANVTGNLKRAWKEFLAEVGKPVLKALIPVLKSVSKNMKNWSEKVKDAIKWAQEHTSELEMYAKAFGVVLAAMALSKVGEAVAGLVALGRAVKAFGKAMQAALGMTNPLGLALLAFGTVAAIVITHWEDIKKAIERVVASWEKSIASIKKFLGFELTPREQEFYEKGKAEAEAYQRGLRAQTAKAQELMHTNYGADDAIYGGDYGDELGGTVMDDSKSRWLAMQSWGEGRKRKLEADKVQAEADRPLYGARVRDRSDIVEVKKADVVPLPEVAKVDEKADFIKKAMARKFSKEEAEKMFEPFKKSGLSADKFLKNAEWDRMVQGVKEKAKTIQQAFSQGMQFFVGPVMNAIKAIEQAQFNAMEAEIKQMEKALERKKELFKEETDARNEKDREAKANLQAMYKNGEISYNEMRKRKEAIDKKNLAFKKKKLKEQEDARTAIAKKQEELKRKQFEANKRSSMANVAINTATAIMQAFAQLGPIGGGIATAVIAATSAAQLAIIGSQKYIPALAKGGVVDKATLAMVGEDGAEAVMPLERNTGWIDGLAGKLNAKAQSSDSSSILARLGAIESLLGQLLAKDTTLVLNTGVLVGATAGKMNGTMGKLATAGTRGR